MSKYLNYTKHVFVVSLIIFLLFSNWVQSLAQKNVTIFSKEINIINFTSDSIKKVTDDSTRLLLDKKIELTFESLLKDARSFNTKLDTLKHIGKTTSPDNKFRIFSWNMPLNDGTINSMQ
jgi:hypothetical protein